MTDDCIFCQIVKGKKTPKKEYEDNEILAFWDIHPVAPVHLLIIPKRHITNLAQTKETDLKILGKIQIIAKKLAQKFNISDGFRLLTASGAKAGQSIFHIHYHLIGGWGRKIPPMESGDFLWGKCG